MARRGSVYLYVPNIIGYVRIALAVVAFANYWDYARFTALYLAGFLLDAADGYAARLLNQQSDFGAALDMLTDRLCTGALLTLLSHLYQPFAPVFLGLIVLDGYSHWLQMAASLCAGASSHKTSSPSRILAFYYWRPVLTVVCLLNELFFLTLYLLRFLSVADPAHTPVAALAAVAAPVAVAKQVVSAWQVVAAHRLMGATGGRSG